MSRAKTWVPVEDAIQLSDDVFAMSDRRSTSFGLGSRGALAILLYHNLP